MLGLSFKPDSPVIIESASIKLIENLLAEGKKVTVYDPLCLDDVRGKFGNKIEYTDSVEDCVRSSELVVVALKYQEFKEINDDWKTFDEHIILDCWRYIDRNNFYPILDEHILQIHSDPRRILSNQKPQRSLHPDNKLENIL